MKTINLIIGILGILIVFINYTIIPNKRRFGWKLAILNTSFGVLNILISLI